MNKQSNTNAKKPAAVLKQFVVRAAPVGDFPVIFDADSLHHGQMLAIQHGTEPDVVGYDFYQASKTLSENVAQRILDAYVEKVGIPKEEVRLRQRLPSPTRKAAHKPRKTNDANLVLAHDNTKKEAAKEPVKADQQESSQDYRSLNEKNGIVDDFQKTVQAMHDGKDVQEHVKEEPKASADNPHGAVVKAQDKPKRKYNRESKAARAKRDNKALKIFQQEISEAVAESETVMEPVAAAPNVDPEFIKEQKLIAALKLAKEVMGDVSPRFVKAIMESDLL